MAMSCSYSARELDKEEYERGDAHAREKGNEIPGDAVAHVAGVFVLPLAPDHHPVRGLACADESRRLVLNGDDLDTVEGGNGARSFYENMAGDAQGRTVSVLCGRKGRQGSAAQQGPAV